MTFSNDHSDSVAGGSRGLPTGGDELGAIGAGSVHDAAAGAGNDGSHASGLSMPGSFSVSLSRDQRGALLELVEGDGAITADVVGGVVVSASAGELAALVDLLRQLRGDRAVVRGLVDLGVDVVGESGERADGGGLVASAIERALGGGVVVAASARGLELAAIYGDEEFAVAAGAASGAGAVVAAGIGGGGGGGGEEVDDSAVLRALHDDERRRSAAGESVVIPVGSNGTGGGGWKISDWLGTRGGRIAARAAMIALAAGLTIGGVALVGRALGPGLFDFGSIALDHRGGVGSHDHDRNGGLFASGRGSDGLPVGGSVVIARGEGSADLPGVDVLGDDGVAGDVGGVVVADGSAAVGAPAGSSPGVLTDRVRSVLSFGPGVGSMEEAAALAAVGRLGVRVVTNDLVASAARTETLASVRSIGGRSETRWRSLDSASASLVCRSAGWTDGGTRLAGVATPSADVWARATSAARASIRVSGGPGDGAMASDVFGAGGGVGGAPSARAMSPSFGEYGWSGVYAVRVSPEPEGLARLVELVAPGAMSVELVLLGGSMSATKVLDQTALFGATDAREAMWWEGPPRTWTWPTVVPVVIDPVVK